MAQKIVAKVNGINLIPGKTNAWIVRSRNTLDPIPFDFEWNPSDFVKARLIGYDEKEATLIFDDGRLAEGTTLIVPMEWANEYIFKKEIEAEDACENECVRTGLPWARNQKRVVELAIDIIEGAGRFSSCPKRYEKPVAEILKSVDLKNKKATRILLSQQKDLIAKMKKRWGSRLK